MQLNGVESLKLKLLHTRSLDRSRLMYTPGFTRITREIFAYVSVITRLFVDERSVVKRPITLKPNANRPW